MANLLIQECLPLIQAMHKGVLSVGLWESLEAFGQADSKPQNRCAQSIFCNYYGGSDFQKAILNATPKLPFSFIQILIAGYRNSMLDYSLADIEKAIYKTRDQSILEEDLGYILEKYEKCKTTEICPGCLGREIELLIAQAQAEKATTVELAHAGVKIPLSPEL